MGRLKRIGSPGLDAEFFQLFLGLVLVHLEFQVEHFRLDSLFSGSLGGLRKMNRAEGLDCPPFDEPVAARASWDPGNRG